LLKTENSISLVAQGSYRVINHLGVVPVYDMVETVPVNPQRQSKRNAETPALSTMSWLHWDHAMVIDKEATKWTGKSGKRYRSRKNKTSRWPETRSESYQLSHICSAR